LKSSAAKSRGYKRENGFGGVDFLLSTTKDLQAPRSERKDANLEKQGELDISAWIPYGQASGIDLLRKRLI